MTLKIMDNIDHLKQKFLDTRLSPSSGGAYLVVFGPAQLSRFHLMTGTESCFRNTVFQI